MLRLAILAAIAVIALSQLEVVDSTDMNGAPRFRIQGHMIEGGYPLPGQISEKECIDNCIRSFLSDPTSPFTCKAIDFREEEGKCKYHVADTSCKEMKANDYFTHVKLVECPGIPDDKEESYDDKKESDDDKEESHDDKKESDDDKEESDDDKEESYDDKEESDADILSKLNDLRSEFMSELNNLGSELRIELNSLRNKGDELEIDILNQLNNLGSELRSGLNSLRSETSQLRSQSDELEKDLPPIGSIMQDTDRYNRSDHWQPCDASSITRGPLQGQKTPEKRGWWSEGEEGWFRPGSFKREWGVDSLDLCKTKCMRNQPWGCRSVSYRSDNGFCQQNRKVLSEGGRLSHNSMPHSNDVTKYYELTLYSDSYIMRIE